MWRSSAPFCASCFEKPTAEVAAQMVGSASCGIASAILIPSAGLTTIGGLQRGCWGPRGGAVLPGHRGRRHDLRLSPVKSRMLLPAMPVPHRSRQSETSRLTKSRSEEHTSELQSLMRISYAVFCLKKQTQYIHKSTHFRPKPNN